MSLDVNANYRQMVVQTLGGILSPDAEVRKGAEDHIRLLEVTDVFGVHLVELIFDTSGPEPIRQLASVLLKQYVESHWNAEAEKMKQPICPDPAKARIRELLPHVLKDPNSRVRASAAYAISTIAHWDWPEEWPRLFEILMGLLKTGESEPVHGAMRVLTEFTRDLQEQHIAHVAPVILPEMYRIFCEAEKYSIRTRGRAVEIFSSIVTTIGVVSFSSKTYRNLLSPFLPGFTEALVKGLQTPDSHHSDCGLKKDILTALSAMLKNVPKLISSYIEEIVTPVWHTLTASATTYMNTVVNAREEANDPTDSDGEIIGFEVLIFTIFDFVQILVENYKYKKMTEHNVSNLIYYLLIYMQMPEEQIANWTSNVDLFVEDEDEDSFAYSVRISSQDLLKVLCEELNCCVSGLVVAVNRLHEKSEQQRASGDASWWKLHEAIMLAMGLCHRSITSGINEKKLDFDISNFIQSVIIPDLDPSISPFLCGRALWCGSRFACLLTPQQVDTFLETTVSALSESDDPVIKVSAVRSVWGFCEYLKESGRQDALVSYLPRILDGLIDLATMASSEILSLILETFCIVVGVNEEFTAGNVSRISTLCIAVFIKANNDPVLVQLVQHVMGDLCANPGCTPTVLTKFVPTLTSILNASSERVPPSIQSVAIDMLETMVRMSSAPLGDVLFTQAFPAVIQRVLNSDDTNILQNGGECLRAYVSVAPEQVLCYRDGEGRNGLHYVVQVASHLLAPYTAEGTAAFVGKLITALMRKMGDHMGNELDQLLRAVLSKLHRAQSISTTQSLVLVFAHLIHIQLEATLKFLGTVPGPTGEAALVFVLTQWLSKQHMFYGSYERKVTAMALGRLLEYSVTSNEAIFQNITVIGDQIVDVNEPIQTRSQRTSKPIRWTQVPALVKMFKLLIFELVNAIESVMGKEDFHDGDDVDDSDPEMDEQKHDNEMMPVFEVEEGGSSDMVDEDIDPDAIEDPLYEVDLQKYLTDFIIDFAKHPSFSAFIPHLNDHEKEVLQGIGLQY